MDHHHHQSPPTDGAMDRNLWASAALNVTITLAEFTGGLFSGSLALLSDAAHNASDVIGLVLSYGAHRVGKLPATQTRTFAFKRAEVLAAFVNAAGLLAVSVWILVEG
ncbi:MAG: cation diffusion facilitator family transporter, partial [Armatimonadota bacterium]|nr:cation diffusion facilitator family transporter [Armatimonadota bacterium]